MRSIIITICFSMTGFMVVAQHHSAYHKHINQAELAIVDSLYETALEHYALAFRNKEMAAAKDYFNAAACAVLTGKESKAFAYLEVLKKKGTAFSVIEESAVFNPLKYKAKKWLQFAGDYEESQLILLRELDKAYRDTLLALVVRDHVYTQKKQDQVLRGQDANLIKAYDDSLRLVVVANTDAFLKLVARKGFPSEARVGDLDASGLMFYDVLIRHALQYDRLDVLPVLSEAVKNRVFPPHQYAWYAEYPGNVIYGTRVLAVKEGQEVIQINAATEEEINKRRNALEMESLTDLLKKAKFSLKDDIFHIDKMNATVRLK